MAKLRYGVFTPYRGAATRSDPIPASRHSVRLFPPLVKSPLYYGVAGMGVAAGSEFVETGIVASGSNAEFVVAAGTSLVIAGAEFVATAVVSLVEIGAVAGALVVSACWLQPYSNKPANALAAVIWIF